MKKKIRIFIARVLLVLLICLNLDFSGIMVEARMGLQASIVFENVQWDLINAYDTYNVTVSPNDVITDGASMVLPTKEEMVTLTTNNGFSGISSILQHKNAQGDEAVKISFGGNASKIQENVLNKISQIVIHEDYPVFPDEYTITSYSGHDVFQGNATINKIMVDTNNKNGFRIREKTFKDMSGLQTVDINVGNGEIKLDGSVFEGCTNLTNVTLTAGTITINGGLNFSGCSNLSKIVFNGNVTFSGEKDFQGCNCLQDVRFNKDATFDGTDTFSNLNLSNTNITFTGNVTNISEGKSAIAFTGCKGIGTVSIGAKDTESSANIGGNFISNSTLTNLNIEGGTTTLAADAIYNSEIGGISFNASTRVEKGALAGCTVGNMYFNTSDVKSSGDDGAIGKNTTVTNIYFNHYDFFRNSDKVTALDSVPLGTGECSLNCTNMFFLSPNFKKINNSPYNSSKVATNVYGYGGTLATYNNEEEDITAKEMFEQWIAGSKNTYHNIIQLTSGQKQGQLEEKKLFVETEDQKVTFDLSSLEIFAKYNENITVLDQLPTDEAGNVRTGEFRLQYTKDPKADTNFNYKVLTKATEASASGQYAYTDGTGVKYITCQEDKLELGVGTYHYYVQAAGETWPLTIKVQQNKISKLKVLIKDKGQKDGKVHVTVGDDLSKVKEYITVMGVLTDEETEVELYASQYKVVKTGLSTEAVTAQDTKLWVYYQDVREEIADVRVHEDKVVSFDLACSKTDMPIGGQLTLEDMILTNITYDNPVTPVISKLTKPTATSGYIYHFLQDGQETDVYTIKSGKNEISVTYEGHVEKISVTGVSNQVKDYEISCNVKEVELYQKSSLDISEVMLEDVVYADERLDGYKEEIVKSGFTFVVNGEETDTVKLEDGENTIRVRYNGLDKKFTVKAYAQSIDRIEVSYCGPAVYEGNEVPKDTSVLLVTVYYKHPYEASVLLSNFEVSYDTYHIVPGENNEIYVRYKGVKSSKPIQVLGLADGLKEIKTVEYRGSNKTGTSLEKDDFYVELEYLSGKVVTSEENPAILDSLTLSSDKLTDGENCIKVVYDGALTGEVNVVANAEGIRVSAAPEASKRPDISTGGSIVSDNTETPKLTIAPNNTVMPMMTVAPGSVSEVPVVTQTPQETDSTSVVPTVSPVAQPQKGSSFTVQGVKYKVNSVTKEGGSVSATGYDKEASKVKLQTAVSLNGYQYTVTKIEKGAFKNCSKLSGTISLTKNVKVIGDSAFYGCKNIKKVVFGSNVTQIGKSSFCNCSKLSTIQFKTGSVKKIGKNAFKGISKKYKVKTTKALKKTYAKRLEGAI